MMLFGSILYITCRLCQDCDRIPSLSLDFLFFMYCAAHQAINQHQDTTHSQNQDDVKAFEAVLKTCKAGTVVVVDLAKMNPANRAWCL